MRLFAILASLLFVSNAFAGDISKCEGIELERLNRITAGAQTIDLKNDKDELVGKIELLDKSTEMSILHLCGANGNSFYAEGDVTGLAGAAISVTGDSFYNDETELDVIATTLKVTGSKANVALYVEHKWSGENKEDADYSDFKTTIYADIPVNAAAKK